MVHHWKYLLAWSIRSLHDNTISWFVYLYVEQVYQQEINTLFSHAVIIFATFGILSKQADPNRSDAPVPESVRILTWIILAVASIQLAVRLAIVIYRYRTRPLFEIEPVPTTVQDE